MTATAGAPGKAQAQPLQKAAADPDGEPAAESPADQPEQAECGARDGADESPATRRGSRKRARPASTVQAQADAAPDAGLAARGRKPRSVKPGLAGESQDAEAAAAQKPNAAAEVDAVPAEAAAPPSKKRTRSKQAPQTAAEPSTIKPPEGKVVKQTKQRARGKAKHDAEARAAGDDAAEHPKAAAASGKRGRAGPVKRAPSPSDMPHSPAFSERAAHAAVTVLSFRAPGDGSTSADQPAEEGRAGGQRTRGAATASAPSKVKVQTPVNRGGKAVMHQSEPRQAGSPADVAAESKPRPGRSTGAAAKHSGHAAKSALQTTPSRTSVGRASAKGADDAKLKMLAHSAPQPAAKRQRRSSQQPEDEAPAAAGTEEASAAGEQTGTAGKKRRHAAASRLQAGPATDPGQKRRRLETGALVPLVLRPLL